MSAGTCQLLIFLILLEETDNSYQVKQVRERQISYDIAYMWHLKKGYKGTHPQNRNRVIYVKNKPMEKNLWLLGVERGGINWKTEIDTYIHTYIHTAIYKTAN